MRGVETRALPIAAAFAAVATACGAAASAPASTPVPPLKVVACDAVIASVASVPRTRRIVLGRVALPRERDVVRGHASSLNRPFPFFAKQGLEVLAGAQAVELAVPASWRRRAAISWGETGGPGQVSKVRIRGCPAGGRRRWLAYPGGYFARGPVCVPLIVRVGRAVAHVRISVGRRCG